MVDEIASTPTPVNTPPTQASPASVPNLTEVFDQIAETIIERQESIIGPVAVERAKQVAGLKVDWAQHDVDISGDASAAIDQLVAQYKELFGQLAVETCKDAVAKFLPQLPPDQVPTTLK